MANEHLIDRLRSFPEAYRSVLREQWQALQPENGVSLYQIERRSLPAPVWVERGLPDSGSIAWKHLQKTFSDSLSKKPFCIYLHIPFCDTHCPFCDCYAFALRRYRERHTRDYMDQLIAELEAWAAPGNLPFRPVTSVHLGGGTPTMLGPGNLKRLVETIQRQYKVIPETEWALETTSSSLDDETFMALKEMGFRRLHIGVQSLQEDVRRAIGRRESGSAVIEKIENALKTGWIVSVDLIFGLPYQTPDGVLKDLDQLMQTGVEGFSIYELQRSRHNSRFIREFSLDATPSIERYFLFQMAFHHLLQNGFSTNVFNHLAKGRDKNLYFTFPQRNEDLLAIGAIADGVFGNYHYRHSQYLPYMKDSNHQNHFLQGGLQRTIEEDRMHELEVQILSGRLSPQRFFDILGEKTGGDLITRWVEYGMVNENSENGTFSLSSNGSWFAGQLLQEARTANIS